MLTYLDVVYGSHMCVSTCPLIIEGLTHPMIHMHAHAHVVVTVQCAYQYT